ncbi:hypothetical protein [Burkholderia sp. BCC0397]|uniref:hypothetical protein n=1 Tax=Burkholderia sp. BCC0397 TaxID=486876 RepID=UPI00158B84EE|nr:hypothetical protein [Burkholderia sp. BCC0397]
MTKHPLGKGKSGGNLPAESSTRGDRRNNRVKHVVAAQRSVDGPAPMVRSLWGSFAVKCMRFPGLNAGCHWKPLCDRSRIFAANHGVLTAPHAANCRETSQFSAFRHLSPPVRLPAPGASRMVLTVRVRPSPGRPTVVPHDGRAGRARRSPSPRRRPPAPCIQEERGVIHKVLILFALCIAGLAAIAAGFQHIPS